MFYPGELEARNAEANLKMGLILPEDTIISLRELGAETGVIADLFEF